MSPIPRLAEIAAYLDADWGLPQAEISELGGGMNSATWLVAADLGRFVAKAVSAATQPGYPGGLAVAQRVDEAGILAGAPVLTLAGAVSVEHKGWIVALLGFVPGRPLTRDSTDQSLIGQTLGRVHHVLVDLNPPEAERLDWVDVNAGHLSLREWLRPPIEAAVGEWRALPAELLQSGLLHSDPAPEAFRLDDRSGVVGLIDWDRALVGPLLYDVASAVMYVGGPGRADDLLRAYVAAGPITDSHIRLGLETALQFRWAVQADYFARRIATNDLTGLSGPAENEAGLEDARRALLARPTR